MSEYRFWGITADGKRELFGMAKNISNIGEAIDVLAAIPRTGLTFTGFEIRKVDDVVSGPPSRAAPPS